MDGGRFLLQLLRIVCGFILALLASGVFLAWGFFQAAHPNEDPVAFATMIGTGLVGASVIGAASLVPAGILIVIAEIARLRGIVFHVAAGGIIAFGLWTLGTPDDVTEIRPGSAVALTAGFLAGAVYWLIAGRMSGAWLGTRAAQSEPAPAQEDQD